MTITLNHTIVSTRDKEGAARFFAEIFGLRFESSGGHFAQVRVNDTLTLDFADAKGTIASQHYAFHVSDTEFDAILHETQFAELVHEKAHARSGRADHLRQRFLTELSHDRLRPAFLAEICKQKEKSGEALFARIK